MKRRITASTWQAIKARFNKAGWSCAPIGFGADGQPVGIVAGPADVVLVALEMFNGKPEGAIDAPERSGDE